MDQKYLKQMVQGMLFGNFKMFHIFILGHLGQLGQLRHLGHLGYLGHLRHSGHFGVKMVRMVILDTVGCHQCEWFSLFNMRVSSILDGLVYETKKEMVKLKDKCLVLILFEFSKIGKSNT